MYIKKLMELEYWKTVINDKEAYQEALMELREKIEAEIDLILNANNLIK